MLTSLGLLLALAVLRAFPLASGSTPVLFLLLAFCAWCAHGYLEPLRRLQRHALLSHLVRPQSRWRGILWESLWSRLRLMAIALTTSVFALLVSVQLHSVEWWALGASVPLFLMCYPIAVRISQRHVQPAFAATMSLRLAGWFVIAVTMVALCVVQMLAIEVADTRSLTFSQVVQSAYQLAYARADSPFIGILLGSSAALSDLSWHSMQVASSSLSLSSPWKAGAWFIFLLLNGLKAGVLWWVMLGAVTRIQSLARMGVRRALRTSLSPLGLIVLGFIVIYAGLSHLDMQRLLSWVPQGAQAPTELSCSGQEQARQEMRLVNTANAHLERQHSELQEAVERSVRRHIKQAFAHTEQGVDAFLDWNFSLRGQYTQLLLLGAELTDSGALTRHLETRLQTLVSDPLETQLSMLDTEVSTLLQTRVQQFYGEHQLLVGELMESSDCLRAGYSSDATGDYLAKSWVGVGGITGIASAVALRGGSRLSAQAAMRALGRRLAARTATTSTARFGARAAAAGSGGTAGLVCGPAAPFCALGFGAATWLAVDLSINAIDEAVNRDQMKRELMEGIQAQRVVLEEQLVATYMGTVNELLAPVYVLHDQKFRVVRDGF